MFCLFVKERYLVLFLILFMGRLWQTSLRAQLTRHILYKSLPKCGKLLDDILEEHFFSSNFVALIQDWKQGQDKPIYPTQYNLSSALVEIQQWAKIMESLFAAPKTELPEAFAKRKSYLRRAHSISTNYKLGGHTPLGLFIINVQFSIFLSCCIYTDKNIVDVSCQLVTHCLDFPLWEKSIAYFE